MPHRAVLALALACLPALALSAIPVIFDTDGEARCRWRCARSAFGPYSASPAGSPALPLSPLPPPPVGSDYDDSMSIGLALTNPALDVKLIVSSTVPVRVSAPVRPRRPSPVPPATVLRFLFMPAPSSSPRARRR